MRYLNDEMMKRFDLQKIVKRIEANHDELMFL